MSKHFNANFNVSFIIFLDNYICVFGWINKRFDNDLEVVPKRERDWFIFSINLGLCLETTFIILLLRLLLILSLLS